MANFSNVESLIKYFNEVSGKRFKFGNKENSDIIEQCLSQCDDMPKAYKFVNEWIAAGNDLLSNNCLINCFRDYSMKLAEEAASKPQAPVAEVTSEQLNGTINLLSQVVTDIVAKTAVDKCEEAVKTSLTSFCDEYIKKTYGPIHRKVELEFPDRPEFKAPENQVMHEKFQEALLFAVAKIPLYLVGPAGSGKNHLVKQLAETLGLEMYFTNTVTQEHKLTGFTDAMGTYHESQFYKAFKYGGLFMLDEIDASIPETLVVLNSAIANGYFDFPAPIGKVEAHENFRVVAAGNTFGYGADAQYVGRNQLDAASLDRFAVIYMDYSPEIEEDKCPDEELLKFLRDYRMAAIKNGILTVVSYRAITNVYTMSNAMKDNLPELLSTCLVKGLGKDDLKHLCDSFEYSNKWTKALAKVYANAA